MLHGDTTKLMYTAGVGMGVYYTAPMAGLTGQQAMMAAAVAAAYYHMYM